ncbi:dihydrodipicolinate synthase family protein [uncultured Tateyamaria sp.]|uniref:dihydrodipicolinate synthase family protein n=1 Tax=uncultured Tateyamaria sp. TaxID=455651 RepID=UPI0026302122|nr:dihydrodipicolinate synthase family protein [uncultured Tateyamaria sp.]
MTPRMIFDGIYTPVVTPFNADYSPDFGALRDVLERLIIAGVHGVISGGSTGENYAMTVEERLAVARETIRVVDGRVPVIMGTGAMLPADSMALAMGGKSMGADALLVATPPYAMPTDRENALAALVIDKAADLPIMLYNYPGRMGVNMGEEFLDRVGRSRNFCAIKESSGDINRVHVLACDYPQIQMSCGMDDQALEFFAWGAKSWVCGGSNFLPDEHIALWLACAVEGNFDKGRRIMSAMLPLMRVLEQGGKFVQTIKYGVTHQGIDTGAIRPPLKALDTDDKRALEQVIGVLKTTIAQIGAEPSSINDAVGQSGTKAEPC